MAKKLLHINLYFFISVILFSCSDNNRIEQSTLPTPEVNFTPGEIISDVDGFVQYYVGNTPIIITVPHDGTRIPNTIPPRSGDSTRAENTQGIAQYFYNGFIDESNGLFPHVILNNIDRSRMDPDSPPSIGAENSFATSYFNRYHTYIGVAIDSIEANFDTGILLNLVSHDDDNQIIEMGFNISKEVFNSSDNILDNSQSQSSISYLSSISSSSFHELVRGFDSIGKRIMDQNCCKPIYYTFDVTPSPDFPVPGDENYNSGGYTLSTYGSHNSTSQIGAMDLSTPYLNHRDSPYAYLALGSMLVSALSNFYSDTTGMSIY